MLLSSGEQISAALLAMAIEQHGLSGGLPAGLAGGLPTPSSDYGNARIKRVDAERIEQELDKRRIVVVTGFQGVNRYGDMTTLGRGGSDTSAVAIAAAHARGSVPDFHRCGRRVHRRPPEDPRGHQARTTSPMTKCWSWPPWAPRCCTTALWRWPRSTTLNWKSSPACTRRPGTIVKEESNVEKMLISGVAKDDNIARISIIGVPDKPGLAFKMFSKLAS